MGQKTLKKVTRFLKYRRILLKRATNKTIRQKGGFLNCLWPLMTVGLPLMKSELTP